MKSKEMQGSNKISAKQEKLIGLLVTERTADAACVKAQVAPSTLWRWMKNDAFLKEYRKIRRSILENAVARLQSLAFQAIDTLERNMNCENPAAEIRSAQIILEQTIRGVETLDVEQRLSNMEVLVDKEEKERKEV